MRFWDGSSISWTICKQSAPRCRQMTPTPHHSIFTGRMLFLTPNQQCQSTEGRSSASYIAVDTTPLAFVGDHHAAVWLWIDRRPHLLQVCRVTIDISWPWGPHLVWFE